MAKKLKIYERFLLGVALTVDSFVNFRRLGMGLYKRKYYDPWLGPGYKPSSFYRTVNRLLKTGYIEKVIKNGKPYLRLTSRAQEKLKRDFSIFRMQRAKWDGKWRLVIFDISEESRSIRDALRDKLKELGFGMLQQSIYITPYDFVEDMYEFLKTEKLLGKAFILTARHELMGEAKDLASLVWKLDKLEEEYEELWFRIISLDEAKDRKKEIAKIKNQYLEIIQKDPFLPYQLLPGGWMAEKIKKAVVSI